MTRRKENLSYKLVNKAIASKCNLSRQSCCSRRHRQPVKHAKWPRTPGLVVKLNDVKPCYSKPKNVQTDNLRSLHVTWSRRVKVSFQDWLNKLRITKLCHSTIQIQPKLKCRSIARGWLAWTGKEMNVKICCSLSCWRSNVGVFLRATSAGTVTAAKAINWLR